MGLTRLKELSAAGYPVALAPEQMLGLLNELEALRARVAGVKSVLSQDTLRLLSAGIRANYGSESVNGALAKYWVPVCALVEE